MIAKERIESMLRSAERKGWKFTLREQHDCVCQYEVDGSNQKLWLTYSPSWVYVQTPLVHPEGDTRERPWPWYKLLLLFSDRVHLVKCSLAADNKAVLQSELPTQQFDVFQLEDALEAIANYRYKHGENLERALGNLTVEELLWQSSQTPSNAAPISAAQVELFFAQIANDGWCMHDRCSDESWRVAYYGDSRRFLVYFTITEAWAYFQAPIVDCVDEETRRRALLTYLLELNYRIYWAKLSLHPACTEEGQPVDVIVLTVEAPANGFNIKRFREAAETLATYLERYFLEISLLGIEPGLGPLVLGGQPDLEWFRTPKQRVSFC